MRKGRTEDYRAAVTVDGDTVYVVRKRPAARIPADREAQVLQGVQLLSALIVAGALVWSTVSIGGLLSLTAPQWVSYMIASAFDATWIGCMALEWVYRYDSARAALPRRTAWVALALSMALITAHGYVHHKWPVGAAGAAVSLVAKWFWSVTMKSTGVELDADTADWVRAKLAAAYGRVAVLGAGRMLSRVQGRADAEASHLSLSVPDPSRSVPEASVPSRPVPIGRATDLSVRVRELHASGMDPAAIREAVRAEFPAAKQDTISKRVARTVNGS
jgi:hypothetical protein